MILCSQPQGFLSHLLVWRERLSIHCINQTLLVSLPHVLPYSIAHVVPLVESEDEPGREEEGEGEDRLVSVH